MPAQTSQARKNFEPNSQPIPRATPFQLPAQARDSSCQPSPVIPAPDYSKPARISSRILTQACDSNCQPRPVILPPDLIQARANLKPCAQLNPCRSGASTSPDHPFPPAGLPRVSTRLTSLTA
ncbi:hypothetical protein TIFTF001_021870 [Ficus carica]|uniref:Uncharacterized protein n=1 Tax=Ficus carica TaxID=3494 RepID=A0AA88ADI6_FICCA|nr:hypothetical protein TIFTF001_021870 [Ficus carica]